MLAALQVFAQTTPTVVTVTGTQVSTTKIYDGTDTSAVINPGTLVGVAAGDSVNLFVSARYAQAYVDTNNNPIPIYIHYALYGRDAAGYVLQDTIDTVPYASILQRQLYRRDVLDSVKIYDGDSICVGRLDSVWNYVTGVHNHVLTTASYYFRDPNVGQNKPVDVTYGVTSEDWFNYIPPRDTVMYSTILPRSLFVMDCDVDRDKLYDGTTAVHINNPGRLTGNLPYDTLGFNLIATYDNKNAGTDRVITLHFSVYGYNSANYILRDGFFAGCVISPIQLTQTGGSCDISKEYDGTVTAHVTAPSYPFGMLPNEREIFLTTVAEYEDSLPGTEKNIWFRYSLYGSDAINYLAPADSLYTTHGEITGELPEDPGDSTAVDMASLNLVKLYPVPAHDVLYMTMDEDGEHIIYMTDAMGRTVMNFVTAGHECRLGLSDLTPGIYFVNIDGVAHKIIKQ